MTTIRQIITDAYQEAGIVSEEEALEASKLDVGLRRLQAIYSSLFGSELGENLLDVNLGTEGLTNVYAKELDHLSEVTSIYIPENVRLILNLSAAQTLYLPPHPSDGSRLAVVDNAGNLATYNFTINGNGRQIESADSVTLNTDSINREWFYRADTGNWVRVIALDVDDQSPLPPEFDDLLVILLAIRIHPRHGAETAPETTEVLKRIRRLFRARYRQSSEQPSEAGIYRLPSTRKHWAGVFSLVRYNRGY